MRNLFKNLLFLALFIAPSALALTTKTIDAVSTDGFYSVQNLVTNGGFEKDSTAGDWTASGGSKSVVTSFVGRGSRSLTWDSNSAGQTLRSKLVTIPVGMYGKNGVVSCEIGTGGAGTFTHTLGVYNGSANVGPQNTITTDNAGSVYIRNSVNFVFPSSGSIQLQMTSVSSNESLVYLDGCVITTADGFNMQQVTQAGFYGSLTSAATAACVWSSSGTSMTAFPADTDCPTPSVTGRVTAPGTKIPGFVVSDPGEYLVVVSGAYFDHSSASSGLTTIKLSDGTISSSVQIFPMVNASAFSSRSHGMGTYKFTKTDAAASTFNIYQDTANSTLTIDNSQTAFDGNGLNFQVFRFPTAAEAVFRPELQIVWGSRYFPDSSGGFSTSSGSFTAITNTNLFSTTTNTGLATACADANAYCLKFSTIPSGSYKFDIQIPVGPGGANTACVYSVYDGTSDYEVAGNAVGASSAMYAASGNTVITYSSAQTNKEFTVRVKRTSGAGTCDVATAWNIPANMTMTPLDQKIPAPVFVGSVSSASTGAMRLESANIAAPSAGACAVTEGGSSDWINGNSTSGATGSCVTTFNSGIWSSEPHCTCTVVDNPNRSCSFTAAPSTTSMTTRTIVADSGVDNNAAFQVHCFGAR